MKNITTASISKTSLIENLDIVAATLVELYVKGLKLFQFKGIFQPDISIRVSGDSRKERLYPNDDNIFLAIYLEEYLRSVYLELFDNGILIQGVKGSPSFFKELLAEAGDWHKYRETRLHEADDTDNLRFEWYEFRYEGGIVSEDTLGDVFKCIHFVNPIYLHIPLMYLERITFARFKAAYPPQSSAAHSKSLYVGEYKIK